MHGRTRWTGERLAALVLAMALGLGVFVLNLPVKGPMIQADEGSYLANAAAIAGFPNDMASSYHAGYSFLIAPAFRLTARCIGLSTVSDGDPR